MKRILPHVLLFAGLCFAAPTQAQEPVASPLLGSWAVDVSRLPVPPEARPKGVTMTFSDAGEGKWTTQVDIVAADGSATHGTSTYPLDGSAAPVVGSSEADTSAVMLPVPEVLIMVLGRAGQGGSTRIFTVAADGRAMTETATYYRQDGTPVLRTNHFTRVR